MSEIFYKTPNFKDKRISVKRAVAILAKNKIEVNDNEASVILDFLYHIATAYNKINDTENAMILNEKSNHRKSAPEYI